MKSNDIFVETLTELMEDHKITVGKLSNALNCDKAAIRRWLYKL